MAKPLLVVLGNQLFPPAEVASALGLPRVGDLAGQRVFMAEDLELCTYARHHRQKIALFLAAMRAHADELSRAGCEVNYLRFEDQDGRQARGTDPGIRASYETKLGRYLDDDLPGRSARPRNDAIDELVVFEIEDRWFRRRIEAFAASRGLPLRILQSPMFLTPRAEFEAYLRESGIPTNRLREGDKRPFMARFYERQRRRLGVLIDDGGKPVGGKWSFDDENRKALPKNVSVPPIEPPPPHDHVRDVVAVVQHRFADHPGELDAERFLWPTTRRQALAWLDRFLDERLGLFGDYEDAFSRRSDFLFHSLLSPLLNLGLITPREVLDRALQAAEDHHTSMNSLEGFVRQIIGWREFIRGMDHHFGEQQAAGNFWDHRRSLTEHWWTADTGLPPLDDAIAKALRHGWTHHIERLMVLANLMNLCEIEPRQVHDWFLAMFVDSSDWVMGPNVYGMGLMSDGGLFATKPYVCGSNYLLKMSDYTKAQADEPLAWLTEATADRKDGPIEAGWGEVVDGLYWRFIDRHRGFFASNPRMSVMTRALDKLKTDRRRRITAAAEAFLDLRTA